jgi:hypothetical protein
VRKSLILQSDLAKCIESHKHTESPFGSLSEGNHPKAGCTEITSTRAFNNPKIKYSERNQLQL